MKIRSCTKCRKHFERKDLKQLETARLCPSCYEEYQKLHFTGVGLIHPHVRNWKEADK